MGLCQTNNRLLNHHVVRFTRAVKFTPTAFVPIIAGRGQRDPEHLKEHPEYPDPHCYLDPTQQYFLRHINLWPLRLEQYKRYFATSKETGEGPGEQTREDTRDAEEEREDHRALVREDHRHHDEKAQALLPSTAFPSRSPHGEKAVRRRNTTLAVCRARVIEPLGDLREAFYEQRLLLGLPWYCPDLKPAAENDPVAKHITPGAFSRCPPPSSTLKSHPSSSISAITCLCPWK